jgi:hypothetical protein
VTSDPTIPETGVKLVSAGDPITVNGNPLLGPPAVVVTTTFPVAAPPGTTATIDVAVQLVMAVATAPLKVTVLLPGLDPKLEPAIVTGVPTGPLTGDKLVIDVGGFTMKLAPPPGPAAVVTTTFPVVAPPGTTATIDPAVQLVMVVATVPLYVTLLAPCVSPKFVPAMDTVKPTRPLLGVRLAIVAGRFIVKATPLLDPPAAVMTTTLPDAAPTGTEATIDVSLQLETAAAIPLNLTEPVPCVDPKLEPLIVIGAPTLAKLGVSVDIDSVGGHADGIHGAGVSFGVSFLDEPLAASMPAAAAPPPTPKRMGIFLLPGFGLEAGGRCPGSVVGRFSGRLAGGSCSGSLVGRFAGRLAGGSCVEESSPGAPGAGEGMFEAICTKGMSARMRSVPSGITTSLFSSES